MTQFLSELSLERFTAHGDREIAFEKPVTIVVGPNASGKTSLKDALEWVLTGACRSTDAAGRGYESLIQVGAALMSVTARIGGLVATRTATAKGTEFSVEGWQGGRKTLEAEFIKKITGVALSRGQLRVLMNSVWFFSQPEAEQREMLFAALGLDFGKGDVIDLLGKLVACDGDGKPTAFTRALAGILEPIPDAKRGAKLLSAIYDAAHAERREAKRTLKALEDQAEDRPDVALPEGLETGDLKAAQAQLADLRAKRDAALVKRQGIEGAHERRLALDAEIADLTAKHDEAEAQIAGLTQMIGGLALPDLGDLKARVEAKREELSKLDGEIAVATAQLDRLTVLVARFEASPGQCALDAEFPCALTSTGTKLFEQLHAALAATQESKMTLSAARVMAAKSLAAMGEDLEAKIRKYGQKVGLEGKREGVIAARDRLADLVEAKSKELAAAFKTEKAVPESLTAEIATLESRIAKGESFVEALVRREEVEKHIKARAAALDAARARVQVLEDLVATFGPEGLPKSLLSDRKEALLAPMVAAVASLTGGEYELAFDDDLAVRVKHGGRDLPVESLSSSERLRMGIGVQVGLAKALSFPLVVIDNADMLDPDNKALFADGLERLAGEGLQIIVLATAEKPEGAEGDETVQYVELRAHRVGAGV